MAATYLFGICRNHPFLDGNKRTAVAVSIRIAEGRVSKAAVTVFLEEHATSR